MGFDLQLNIGQSLRIMMRIYFDKKTQNKIVIELHHKEAVTWQLRQVKQND